MRVSTSEECAHIHTKVIQERMCFVNTFCSAQKKLTTLDIAANRIKRIENISHLTDLQEFWVSRGHMQIVHFYWILGMELHLSGCLTTAHFTPYLNLQLRFFFHFLTKWEQKTRGNLEKMNALKQWFVMSLRHATSVWPFTAIDLLSPIQTFWQFRQRRKSVLCCVLHSFNILLKPRRPLLIPQWGN